MDQVPHPGQEALPPIPPQPRRLPCHRRHSIRQARYDYSSPGAYFVTVVTRDRRRPLSSVHAGVIRLKPAGRMVLQTWTELAQHYPGLETDAFVVMPDHIHGIIILLPTPAGDSEGRLSPSDLMQPFKGLTTRRYIDAVRSSGWPPFRRGLRQRNCYERIIRDTTALDRVRAYIRANPTRWPR